MATTIQISDGTKQLLETLKDQEGASSYDQVIHEMLRERMRIPKSLFGSVKGTKWTKKDRFDFHE